MSTDQDSRLFSILASVLERIDRGEPIDRQRLLDEHPDLRAQLDSFLSGDRLLVRFAQDHAPRGKRAGWHASHSLPSSPPGFDLLEEIGRGGMGVVYRARQERPDRIVALKMVLSGRYASDKSLRRFAAEAEAAGGLKHPAIVAIHQVGQHDGQPFCVMDFIEGESLEQRLATGPLAPRLAAQLLGEIAGAVEYAHQRGVVHRDLKPANILLDRQGRAYVADFGLARRIDAPDPLTATGEVVGTASYMAPEQAGQPSHAMGPATDIYGLGAVLYAMLTGWPPFQGADRSETIAQVKSREPAPLRSINDAVPRDLETIALKCLQKDPHRRYPSAALLADDLRRYLAGRPIAARPVGRLERLVRWTKRNPVTSALLALVAVSLALGAVVGSVLALRARHSASESAQHLYLAHMNLAQQYWDAGRTAPVLELLGRYAPQAGQSLDRRGWEWHYQWNLCHRELRQIGRWSGAVHCVAVSPDGLRIAAAGDAGDVQLFETATGRRLRQFHGHRGAVYDVVFSPDGSRLASGGADQTLRIWQLHSDKAIATLRAHSAEVRRICFTPDGSRLISSSEDGDAWLWDAKTFQRIRSFQTGPARAIAFHPDGSRFACAARDGVVHLWNTTSGQRTNSFPGHSQSVYGLAFTRDGKRLFTTSSDGLVRSVDVDSGQIHWSIAHRSNHHALALSRDETSLAVASADQTARVLDAASGRLKWMVRGHTDWVHGAAFLADGSRLLTTGADGTVRLWNQLCSGEGRTLHGHEQQVFGIAFSPDGKTLATASLDWSIALWDASTGLLRRRLYAPLSSVLSVAFSPDGKWLAAGSYDRSAYLWNTARWNDGRSLGDHGAEITGVSFSPDAAALAATSGDGCVHVWDIAARRLRLKLASNARSNCAPRFSPNGRTLVSGHNDGTVRVWSASDGKLRRVLKAHRGSVRAICFMSADDGVATAGSDGIVRLWDIESGRELDGLRGHDQSVVALAISPQAARLASGGNDRTIKLWELDSNQEVRTLEFSEPVRGLAFSPDGHALAASGANGAVRIWASSFSGDQDIVNESLGLIVHLESTCADASEVRAAVLARRDVSLAVHKMLDALLERSSLVELAQERGHRAAREGRWQDAAEAFAQATRRSPQDVACWQWRALCELQLGRRDNYRRVCRQMIERVAHQPTVVELTRMLETCCWTFELACDQKAVRAIAERLDVWLRDSASTTAALLPRSSLALFSLCNGDARAAERHMDYVASMPSLDSFYLKSLALAMQGNSAANRCYEDGEKLRAAVAPDWVGQVRAELFRSRARDAISRLGRHHAGVNE
jgi:WD40 repeat protein/tRNA A-37 threonylcarbamoyl transferase component Bud32